MQLLETDSKLRDSLEKDIQGKIKEMRSGKKVLDDDALEALEVQIKKDNDEATAESTIK
jgi:hypothetical protein